MTEKTENILISEIKKLREAVRDLSAIAMSRGTSMTAVKYRHQKTVGIYFLPAGKDKKGNHLIRERKSFNTRNREKEII